MVTFTLDGIIGYDDISGSGTNNSVDLRFAANGNVLTSPDGQDQLGVCVSATTNGAPAGTISSQDISGVAGSGPSFTMPDGITALQVTIFEITQGASTCATYRTIEQLYA